MTSDDSRTLGKEEVGLPGKYGWQGKQTCCSLTEGFKYIFVVFQAPWKYGPFIQLAFVAACSWDRELC